VVKHIVRSGYNGLGLESVVNNSLVSRAAVFNIVMRLWRGALRDDAKNGWEGELTIQLFSYESSFCHFWTKIILIDDLSARFLFMITVEILACLVASQ